MALHMLIMGPPGVGKGTNSAFIQHEWGILPISSGNLLREYKAKTTPLGLEIKGYMERGELVPDPIINKMVEDRISQPDAKSGVLLDGFPRKPEQGESLMVMLDKLGAKLTLALYLEGQDYKMIERLSDRLLCTNCPEIYNVKTRPPMVAGVCNVCNSALMQRDDDKPDAIKKRLEIFHAETEPVINWFRSCGKLWTISGDQPEPIVQKQIKFVVNYALGPYSS